MSKFKAYNNQIFTVTPEERLQRVQDIEQICGICSECLELKNEQVQCKACKTCGKKTVSMLYEICPLGKFTSAQLERKLLNLFDRVVVINLKRRSDRLDRFWNHYETIRWPFKRPVVFEAVDGSKIPVPEGWKAGTGAWGCMQSHRQILEKALMDGCQSILILEDDAYFVPQFAGAVSRFIEDLPSDWEGLMIGGQHFAATPKVSNNIVRCVNTQRTHCYAVRGQLMRDLYAKWCASSGHCDHVMGPFLGGYKVYAPEIFLCAQDANKSDISGRLLPRKFWNPTGEAPIVHLHIVPELLSKLPAYYVGRQVSAMWAVIHSNQSAKAKGIALRQYVTNLRYEASAVENGVAAIVGEIDPLIVRTMLQDKYIERTISTLQEGLDLLAELNEGRQKSTARWYGHAGDFGDIIYSLPAIRATGGGILYLYNKPRSTRMSMTKERADLIRPLLVTQPYITDCIFSGKQREHSLNSFRAYRGNLAEMHLAALGMPRDDCNRAWLTVTPKQVARIIFHRSPRYRNDKFPWKAIYDRYKSEALFIGLKDEHANFAAEIGGIPHYVPADFLELAQMIAGSELFVGNQSAPAAVAEGLKHTMILEECLQAANCHFTRENKFYTLTEECP